MLRIVRGLIPALALVIAVPFAATAAEDNQAPATIDKQGPAAGDKQGSAAGDQQGPAAEDKQASAAPDSLPKPADLIFNSRHLDLVGKGGSVKYTFQHEVNDAKLMGQPFKDDIVLNISDVNQEGARALDVTVFTGERQRPTQNYEGITINPVFIWFLDKCIENYRLVSGGKQPYLKGRMSDSFIDKAKIEPVKIDFGGKSVDAYKVTLVPFETDPNKHKMQGFEKSKFTFVFSKDVPGYFYELQSEIFSSQAGTGTMTDRLVLVEAK